MKKLNYLQGALILSAANLITSSLAFYFRVYYSKHVGAEGMGIFQLVYSLYMLLITLASGGITTALSKVVAEYHATGQIAAIRKTLKLTYRFLGLWSIMLCLLIYLNTDQIASLILKDDRTTLSLIVLLPAILFISMSAIFRGYFFGMNEIRYPAFIDMIEKVIRLGALMLITDKMLPYGIAYASAGAMLATTIGELMSVFLLYIVFLSQKSSQQQKKSHISYWIIFHKIKDLALPLAFGSALMTINDMISAVLVPSQLQLAGYDPTEALSLYGELIGMVMPLIFFPGIIVFALTTTLVPAITQSYVNKNQIALDKKCRDSLTIAWSLGLLTTVFSISFSEELCGLLFNCPEAGSLLYWSGFGCPFYYLQFIQSAIFNSIGLQRHVLINAFFDIFITVACIYLLIPIPWIGIYGYIIGFILSGAFVAIRNMLILKKFDFNRVSYWKILWKPIFSFVLMYLTVKLLNSFFTSVRFTYNMAASGLIGILAFAVSLIWNGVFTSNQIKKTILFR